ncbi:MAG: Membrane protein insertase, YidC/Oxa1 family [Microgenomates group bacterium GW2011_GWA2_44_7]|nr:MAG: Membrane protein insertase, YidC/Oxa1 family [Microgenomates group bacterium GW2011_GWA2_44_7]KKT77995.1 MAG: Membrane protein insertase, YidC/Oxa1 family [Microgenomates group bacterium GW2011_GWB1_44_8]
MIELWTTILYQPIINGLIFLYQSLGQNLGLAIIALTALIRLILVPFTNSSLRAAKKMQELAPEIAKLKDLHKDNKTAFASAQMELYKKHGANPAAGCLPQIIQLIVLIALYQAFNQVLTTNGETISKLNQLLYPPLKLAQDAHLNTNFLYLNLAKPDFFQFQVPSSTIQLPLPGLFLLLAVVVQFLSSKMMLPAAKKAESLAKKTPQEADDVMAATQEQMLYLFPIMTLFFGFSFPSGLILYWFLFSLLSSVQQYLISGWGGLTPWINIIKRS